MSYLNKVVNIYEAKGAKDLKDVFSDLGATAKPVNTDGAGQRKKPMKNDNPLPAMKHDRPEQAKQAKKDVKTPRTQQKDSNDPNVKPASLKSHTEYKRMGVMMAEALGYRVDEIAPLAAAAGRLAMSAGKNMVKKKAMGMVADKMKKKEQEKEEKPGMEVAHTEYRRIGDLMAEALGLREEEEKREKMASNAAIKKKLAGKANIDAMAKAALKPKEEPNK